MEEREKLPNSSDGIGCLIRALTILKRYGNAHNPTHCEHDDLIVSCVDASKISPEDLADLGKLGFDITWKFGGAMMNSLRFGSS